MIKLSQIKSEWRCLALSPLIALTLLTTLTSVRAGTSTIQYALGPLDSLPDGAVGILVADSAQDGFQSLNNLDGPSPTVLFETIGESDDVIVGVAVASGSGFGSNEIGFAETFAGVDYEAVGLAPGVPLRFFVFPDLTSLTQGLNTGLAFESFEFFNNRDDEEIGYRLPVAGGVHSLSHLDQANGGLFADLSPIESGEVGDALVIPEKGTRIDLTGDGNPDLLIASPDGTLALWGMNGSSVNSVTTLPFSIPEGWQVALLEDFNNDGLADFLLRHPDGNLAVWYFDGTAITGEVTLTANFVAQPLLDVNAAADFDEDGTIDLVVRHPGTGTIDLWFYDGLGLRESIRVGVDRSRAVVGVGDFDGDGNQDLLLTNQRGQFHLWLLDESRQLVAQVALENEIAPEDWVASVDDWDGDGDPDLLVQSASGALTLHYYEELSPASTTAAQQNLTVTPDLRVANTGGFSQPTFSPMPGDFNGDGVGDLTWQYTPSGNTAFWHLSGTFGLDYVSVASHYTAAAEWRLFGHGDVDGNGHNDMMFQHSTSGEIFGWQLDSASFVESVHFLDTQVVAPSWEATALADFDQDGTPDLLLQDQTTGATTIWYLDGFGKTGDGALGTQLGADWRAAAVADFNRDGNSDLMWQNRVDSSVQIWYLGDTSPYQVIGGGAISMQFPALSDWVVAGAQDTNDDANPDIIWQNSSTGDVMSWHLNGLDVIGNTELDFQLRTSQWEVRNSRSVSASSPLPPP